MISLFTRRGATGELPTWGVTVLVTSVLGLSAILVLGTLSTLASGWPVESALNIAWRFWAVWLIAAPFIAQLNFRYPLEAPHTVRRGAYLAILGIAVIGMNQWIPGKLVGQRPLVPPPPQTFSGPPNQRSRLVPPSARQSDLASRRRGPQRRQARYELRFALVRGSMDALIYLALCGSCQAWAWSQRARERERRAAQAESALARAQLAALQMQINPHFLFNSLNGIAGLIHTDPDTADNMLVDLSSLLREALDLTGEAESTLSQELRFIERYLAIETARFGDRLNVDVDIPEALADARLPTFILQPLVENAIRHGIEKRRSAGIVRLRAAHAGEQLIIDVEDDGPGPQPNPNPAHGGLGLTNTRARLNALYEGDADFALTAITPHGSRARLTLPWRTKASAKEPENDGCN